MNRTAKIIREERAEKIEAMQSLHKKSETEKRSLSKEELEKWEAFNSEVEALKTELRTVERQESLDNELAAIRGIRTEDKTGDISKKEKRELANYSFLKAIQSRMNGVPLTGLELEMDQEARNEARENGVSVNGIGIPGMILEKRDNSITMPIQPEDGSAVMIQKQEYGSMLDMLRDALVTRQLGATYLNDLKGNLAFNKVTNRPLATWKPEVGNLDKSNVKFGAEDFAPKRVGTYILESKQFLNQTSAAVERKIREEILYSIAEAVDRAAVRGSGLANEPTGILTLAANGDIQTIAIGANGGELTRAHLLAVESTLAQNNVTGRNFGWLINAKTRGKLKNTIIAAGSDKFLLESNTALLDYPVVMSNMVPSDIVKGTGTGLSAAVFGDWSELFIGQWGGIDLLVDPYTQAIGGQIQIVAQAFFNTFVRRDASFVTIRDIATT